MAEARATEAGSSEPAKAVAAPLPEQLTAIKAAIANAQTLEEVQRLEAALKQGQMPSQLEDPGVSGAAATPSKELLLGIVLLYFHCCNFGCFCFSGMSALKL